MNTMMFSIYVVIVNLLSKYILKVIEVLGSTSIYTILCLKQDILCMLFSFWNFIFYLMVSTHICSGIKHDLHCKKHLFFVLFLQFFFTIVQFTGKVHSHNVNYIKSITVK